MAVVEVVAGEPIRRAEGLLRPDGGDRLCLQPLATFSLCFPGRQLNQKSSYEGGDGTVLLSSFDSCAPINLVVK